jgi:hypothetical protein
MTKPAAIASLAQSAVGFGDAAVRYLLPIKADTDPDEIRALLTRAYEAHDQFCDVMASLERLAPNAAKAGRERAATIREGLKI